MEAVTTIIPAIAVQKMPAGYFNLFIDGKKKEFFSYPYKDTIRKYLKRTYNIDLRTDPRISKNYKEFETRKVSETNGTITYIKRQLMPTQLLCS